MVQYNFKHEMQYVTFKIIIFWTFWFYLIPKSAF